MCSCLPATTCHQLDYETVGLEVDLRAIRHRRLRFRNLLQSATLSGSPALVSDLNPTRAEVIAKDADGNTHRDRMDHLYREFLAQLMYAYGAPGSKDDAHARHTKICNT